MPDVRKALKNFGGSVIDKFRPDSVEKIVKDFFKISRPTIEEIETLEDRAGKLKNPNDKTKAFLIATGFRYYVKDENDMNSMNFRDIIMAIRNISDMINDHDKKHADKWKKKGEEYFDHLYKRVEECKKENNEAPLILEFGSLKEISNSTKTTYPGYATTIGYDASKTKEIMEFLKSLPDRKK